MFRNSIRKLSSSEALKRYTFRVPNHKNKDAISMWRIAKDSKVLEVNTPYCYLAFVDHFGKDGCIVCENNNSGDVVGYVQGYRPPTHNDTVFVWQIGVDASERGQGLGKLLLKQLAYRLSSSDNVKYLEATVTPSNIASRKLFRGFARDIGSECIEKDYFLEEMFPVDPPHEAEDLFRIGPFTKQMLEKAVNDS